MLILSPRDSLWDRILGLCFLDSTNPPHEISHLVVPRQSLVGERPFPQKLVDASKGPAGTLFRAIRRDALLPIRKEFITHLGIMIFAIVIFALASCLSALISLVCLCNDVSNF